MEAFITLIEDLESRLHIYKYVEDSSTFKKDKNNSTAVNE